MGAAVKRPLFIGRAVVPDKHRGVSVPCDEQPDVPAWAAGCDKLHALARVQPPDTGAMDDHFELRIEPAGWPLKAGAGQSLLVSALGAGVVLPHSCRNGTCRTCLCRLLSGSVHYSVEWPGLSREEKAEGWILPCVARPLSDVVLQVPHARRAG
jgi:ferredoxin